MKSASLFSIGASIISGALAGTFTHTMTHNGVEVPVFLTNDPSIKHRPLALNSSDPHSKRGGIIENFYNWCGTEQTSPVSGSFHTITGTWNVPGIYPPPGAGAITSSQVYQLSEWVGLGSDCGSIFQAGTAQVLTESGGLQQVAWWEWWPDNDQQNLNMPIAYFDEFKVTLTATPNDGLASGGVAVIENLTQGFTYTVTLTDFSNICLDNAEWIVENPNYQNMAWPTFEDVFFTGCQAVTTTGATQGITGTVAIHGDSSDGRTILSEYENNGAFYVQP